MINFVLVLFVKLHTGYRSDITGSWIRCPKMIMTQSYAFNFLYMVSLYVYQTHTSFPASFKDSPKSYELLCIKSTLSMSRHEFG